MTRRGVILTITLTVGGLAVGVGVFSIFRHFDYPMAAGEAKQALAAYRAAGLPVSAKDLPRTDQYESGVATYLPEFKRLLPISTRSSWEQNVWAPFFTGKKLDLARQIVRNRDAIELAVKASKCEHLDWQTPRSDEYPTRESPLDSISRATQLLAMRGITEAQAGRNQSSLRDFTACFRLQDRLDEPTSDDMWMLGVENYRRLCYCIQKAADYGRNDSAFLKKLAALIERPIPKYDLASLIRFEAYNCLAQERGEPLDRQIENTRTLATVVRIQQLWVEVQKLVVRFGDDWDGLRRAVDTLTESWAEEPSETRAMASYRFPYLLFWPVRNQRISVRLVTLALIKALLFEQKTGQLPTSLQDLPGQWTDPFSSRPLLFKRRQGQLLIYGVGENGKDDNGTQSDFFFTALGDDISASCALKRSGGR